MKEKLSITPKQIEQFNLMRAALIRIGSEFQTTSQLRRNSEKQYGLDYDEVLEMSYENIQTLAQYSVRGIKRLQLPQPKSTSNL